MFEVMYGALSRNLYRVEIRHNNGWEDFVVTDIHFLDNVLIWTGACQRKQAPVSQDILLNFINSCLLRSINSWRTTSLIMYEYHRVFTLFVFYPPMLCTIAGPDVWSRVLRCPLHETIWLSGSKVIEISAAHRWLHYCKMQRSRAACRAFKCLSNFDPKPSHIDATSPFLHLPYALLVPWDRLFTLAPCDVMSPQGTMLHSHCNAFVTNFRPFRAGMSHSISTKGRLKRGDCSESRHVGGEGYNRLLLLILNLSSRCICRSSVSLQAHTSVNLTEAHLYFI